MKKELITGIIGAAALVATAQVSAEAVLSCDAAATVFDPEYDECLGSFAGNDSGGGTNYALNKIKDEWGADGWISLGKHEEEADDPTEDPETSDYFEFTGFGTTGYLEFDAGSIEAAFGGTFEDDYDVAVSFKAANAYSIYWWEAGLGTDTIEWSTAGTSINSQGIPQDLSHGSAYIRPNTQVPEPLTLGMFGLSLIGLGFMRKRA